MARPFLAAGILVLLLALPPQAAACTSTSGPYQSVRFVATEAGRTILDLPTSIQVGPNGLCGVSAPPPLHFDGRFAAWPTAQGLHVVDVTTGSEADHPHGVLTAGHVAVLAEDGLRPNVTLLDLAAGTSSTVAAPDGESFVANLRGAVVARVAGAWPGTGQAVGVSVLDPASAAWLLRSQPVARGGDDVLAGSRDWVLFGDDADAALLRVATGAVTSLAPGGRPVGIVGDRLYLQGPASWTSTGGSPAMRTWSVALPAGDDPRDGALPEQRAANGREVAFVVQGTGTQAPGSGSPTGLGDVTATATPSTTAPASRPRADDGVIDLAPGWAWLAFAAVLLAAWSARRRL